MTKHTPGPWPEGTEMTMWVARHEGEIEHTARTKHALLWRLRANHCDERTRTCTRAKTVYGPGYVYVAPRGERYIITREGA